MPRNIKPFGVIVLSKYTEGSMSCFGSLSAMPFPTLLVLLVRAYVIKYCNISYVNCVCTPKWAGIPQSLGPAIPRDTRATCTHNPRDWLLERHSTVYCLLNLKLNNVISPVGHYQLHQVVVWDWPRLSHGTFFRRNLNMRQLHCWATISQEVIFKWREKCSSTRAIIG